MRLPSKPHPALASFIAAAVALLPVLLITVSEITAVPSGVGTAGEADDGGYRGAALAFVAMPFLYIAVVPICYAVGVSLVSLRLRRLASFLAGTAAIALLLGLILGLLIGAPARFGISDIVPSIAVSTSLFLISTLPAATCWWFLAVRPHVLLLNPDTSQSSTSVTSSVMHSRNKMTRIDESLLDWKDDLLVFEGKPYSGLTFLKYKNGNMEREMSYDRGLPSGKCMEWYESGQLKSEWLAVRSQGASEAKEYYESGKLLSNRLAEHNIEILFEKFDESGVLIEQRKLEPGSSMEKLLERMRELKA